MFVAIAVALGFLSLGGFATASMASASGVPSHSSPNV